VERDMSDRRAERIQRDKRRCGPDRRPRSGRPALPERKSE
jgi:hypothetical protein